jgi:hypothetical protein
MAVRQITGPSWKSAERPSGPCVDPLPEDPEAGGGLIVAIVKFSIMAGAVGGGMIYDRFGPTPSFWPQRWSGL